MYYIITALILLVIVIFIAWHKKQNRSYQNLVQDRTVRLGSIELSSDTPAELIKAAQAMRNGDTMTALQMMVLHDDPSSYYFQRGVEAGAPSRKEYQLSIELFSKGISLGESEKLPLLYRSRALSKIELGDRKGALADLNRSFEVADKSKKYVVASILNSRSEVKRLEGDVDGADIDAAKAELILQEAKEKE